MHTQIPREREEERERARERERGTFLSSAFRFSHFLGDKSPFMPFFAAALSLSLAALVRSYDGVEPFCSGRGLVELEVQQADENKIRSVNYLKPSVKGSSLYQSPRVCNSLLNFRRKVHH